MGLSRVLRRPIETTGVFGKFAARRSLRRQITEIVTFAGCTGASNSAPQLL